MTTARFLWPLLMVAALIATGLLMKYFADRRRRKRKGTPQHPKVRSIN
jgi:hypothetical protein